MTCWTAGGTSAMAAALDDVPYRLKRVGSCGWEKREGRGEGGTNELALGAFVGPHPQPSGHARPIVCNVQRHKGIYDPGTNEPTPPTFESTRKMPSPPPASISTLAPELLYSILAHLDTTLVPYVAGKPQPFRDLAQLITLATVARSWTLPSQSLLYRAVFLRDSTVLDLWKQSRATGMYRTADLQLWGSYLEKVVAGSLEEVIGGGRIVGLEKLHLVKFGGGLVAGGLLLESMLDLKTLILDRVLLSLPSPVRFPFQLRALTLSGCEINSEALESLFASSSQSLESLSLGSGYLGPIPSLSTHFHLIAPTLRELTVPYEFDPELLKLCPQLIKLTLNVGPHLATIVLRNPIPSLKVLSMNWRTNTPDLRAPERVFVLLVDALIGGAATGWGRLETVVLDRDMRESVFGMAIAGVMREAKKHGVEGAQVQWVEGLRYVVS
jgi:hypothetical protein